MFLRLLYKTFTRSFKDKLLIILTVAFGASLASFMINFSLDFGDKMNEELKSYGANITVEPKMDTIPVEMDGLKINPLGDQAFLQEKDLNQLKKIFWANNILDFVPYLETTGKLESKKSVHLKGTWFKKNINQDDKNSTTVGLATMKSWWKLNGKWPEQGIGSKEIIVGKQLADELNITKGNSIRIETNTLNGSKLVAFQVVGIIEAGGEDDETIFVPLASMQKILGLPGKISSAEVSALTVPETEKARKAAENPSYLSEKEYETWYCTAYASSIAYQIEEEMKGSVAKPIRQIAQSEGVILNKIKFMMFIISIAAIISSALGIMSLMYSKISERGREIALMKAIGATEYSVVLLFICEAMISGIIGGIAGYGIGILITQFMGQSIFGTVIKIKLIGLPLILLLSIIMTSVGSYPTIRKIIKLDPVGVLQGR
ncbi:ABC transporter permease [Neobacillus niacini]|uniref:ABC transporter permease n=1 Tax=Neobacillus niacini TaxID=86668 RepID=UPI00285744AC|nr:ABC transporter permease [Neobacillus niacini]MDR6999495.1 putative ABC transport system permease protein [Neobacillus niacini]